jgi:hypothetical protein
MLRCGIRVMRKMVSHRDFVCFLHTSGRVPASTRFLADSAGLGERGRRTKRACFPDRYPWRRWPPTLLDRSTGLLHESSIVLARSRGLHV